MAYRYFLIFLLVLFSSAHAEESQYIEAYPECESTSICDEAELFEEDEDLGNKIFSVLDRPQKKLADVLEKMAEGMDRFFSREEILYDDSGTYAKWTLDTLFEEGGEVSFDSRVRVRLRLPQTQKKLKLVVETDADVKDVDTTGQEFQPTPQEAVQEKTYFAGLERDYGKKGGWQYSPSIGIKLHSPVDPYIRFRFIREFLNDDWLFRFTEMPFWFDSTGWGSETTFQFDIHAGKSSLFRSISNGRWTRQTEFYDLSQVFSLIHTISDKKAVSFNIGAYGIDEPTIHVTDYLVSLNYRQRIHSDYLFMELVPHVRYFKENDFEPEHAFILRLEMVIKE